jgi:hypothetical protein
LFEGTDQLVYAADVEVKKTPELFNAIQDAD